MSGEREGKTGFVELRPDSVRGVENVENGLEPKARMGVGRFTTLAAEEEEPAPGPLSYVSNLHLNLRLLLRNTIFHVDNGSAQTNLYDSVDALLISNGAHGIVLSVFETDALRTNTRDDHCAKLRLVFNIIFKPL